MSKLYKRYLELKEKDSSKIYLFKSGIFYIFLEDDAKRMSSILNLKLANLNEHILKCGFPVAKLDKYINLINNLGYNLQIIDTINLAPIPSKNYLTNNSLAQMVDKLSKIKSDELSIREAYILIDEVTSQAKQIKKEMEN